MSEERDIYIEAMTAPYGKPFDPVKDIEEFHKKFGLEYDGKPRSLEPELSRFRRDFMKEELREYEDHAVSLQFELGLEKLDQEKVAKHLEEMLDGLVDLVYVVLGTSHIHGFDFKEAWHRVHAANMAKVRVAKISDSKRGSAYDVVKPEGWTAPDHSDLVKDNVHANQN